MCRRREQLPNGRLLARVTGGESIRDPGLEEEVVESCLGHPPYSADCE